MARLAALALLAWATTRPASGCPIGRQNMLVCSGHGHCPERTEVVPNVGGGGRRFIQEQCVCDQGFTGGDCSYRVCPAGRAWFDYAQANQSAHLDFVECSNHGYCDRVTGECECRNGFGGHACERMLCPVVGDLLGRKRECAGNGRCLSMAEAAVQQDFLTLEREAYYDGWDADMIYGCACDKGFTGWDCAERSCPKGHDPLVEGRVDEVQLLECFCEFGCNGTLAVTYRGQRTDPIPWDATPELLKARLEALSTVAEVDVSFHGGGPQLDLCSELAPGTTAEITFTVDKGDLPALNVTTGLLGGLSTANIATNGEYGALHPSVRSVRGTKQNVECSNRGTCDRESGTCACYRGFEMSDGKNGEGLRSADCGFFALNASAFIYANLDRKPNATEGPCPRAEPLWDVGVGKSLCSSAGVCQADKTCNCSSGFEGPACEFKTCPAARAWWDEAAEDGRAHDVATCSNRGTCNRATGECACDQSFFLTEGDACNQLSCFLNLSETCGPYGTCQTMATLAENSLVLDADGRRLRVNYTDPWDAYMIQGCQCQPGAGLWETAIGDYTYRGPFAYAFTETTGYSCAHAFCPTGDNPFTFGENEVQTLNCTAFRGSFNITFRDATPVIVPWHSSPSEFANKLRRLSTIRNVSVVYNNGTWQKNAYNDSICDGDGTNVTIEFLSERGDVPLFYLDTTDLQTTHPVTITETIKGTKEDLECAGFGLCNREIGHCECLDGFYSGGDDVPFGETGVLGQRGDCSFRHDRTSKDTRFWIDGYKYVYNFELPEFDT